YHRLWENPYSLYLIATRSSLVPGRAGVVSRNATFTPLSETRQKAVRLHRRTVDVRFSDAEWNLWSAWVSRCGHCAGGRPSRRVDAPANVQHLPRVRFRFGQNLYLSKGPSKPYLGIYEEAITQFPQASYSAVHFQGARFFAGYGFDFRKRTSLLFGFKAEA